MRRVIVLMSALWVVIFAVTIPFNGSGGVSVPQAAAAPQATVQLEAVTQPVSAVRMDPRNLPRVRQFNPRVHPVLSSIPPDQLAELKRRPAERPVRPLFREAPVARTVVGPQTAQPAAPPTVGTNFQGPMQSDNASFGFLARPPDPDNAVGPNHVGTVVNAVITFYTKSGTEALQNSLDAWFNDVCLGCTPFDPRIVYDPQQNRWMVVALHVGANISRILLSVSSGSDPTGTWANYNIDAVLTHPTPTPADTWADYPDVAYDGILSTASPSGAIYITANQFTFSGDLFRTAIVYILPKSALYAGAALPSYWRVYGWTNGDSSPAFTLRAGETYGNPGAEYLINTRGDNADFVSLWRVTPNYPPTMPTINGPTTVSIGPYSVPPDATQSGGCGTLDTIDTRAYNAVWRNNRIYTSFAQAYNWGSGTVAAIRWLKINTTTNIAEVNVVGGGDLVHYFMPAIAVDSSQNIVLSFARSSASQFTGLYMWGHRVGAPAPELSVTQVHAGVQCITGFRWGDYFGAAIDPADLLKVWVFGEWASNEGPINSVWDWGTWVAQVTFPPLFGDVFPTDFYYSFVEELYNRGITGGCSTMPLLYCPGSPVTREQMAVFIIRSKGSPVPACTGIFADVPVSDPLCGYVEQMYNEGITSGCATAPLRYCPNDPVTRGQMAVFLMRGAGQTECNSCGPTFADVLPSHPFYGWIERLYQQGVTGGCATSPLRYCPDANVTRAQMAIFLIRTFFK